jgi:hypothetical protein
VKKKDGSIRVTQDFRKLNSVTVKDAYPIPRIDSMLHKLAGAKLFTTIDLASGYYQVGLSEESKQYTAFGCEFGFYEYNVMPMGLTNACATFQRMMNKVFDGLIGQCCFVYLDDIIVFSTEVEDHRKHVKMIINRLREFLLRVKTKKVRAAEESVVYLSHEIHDGKISPGKDKVEALHRMPQPKSTKQAQCFHGLASYYRKFVDAFSTVMSPIIRCTENRQFAWSAECEQAFHLIKELITSDCVLILPDFSKEFVLETDASNVGVGAVL